MPPVATETPPRDPLEAAQGGPGAVAVARLGPRERIVQATAQIIAERGVLAATTRAIAVRAECAEGGIYRYFPDKHAILHAVVMGRFEGWAAMVDSLPGRAGQGTVRDTLEDFAVSALEFHRSIVPMIAAHLADPELLEGQRADWERKEGGPLRAIRALTGYLRAEQRLGRIDRHASPELAARLVLGTCLAHAVLVELVGEAGQVTHRDGGVLDDGHYAIELVRTVWKGIEPGAARAPRPQRSG